jgi:tetratricopeptide (TPR) repeat protein
VGSAQAVRLRLRRPLMASLAASDGEGWTLSLADAAAGQPQPLEARRNLTDPSRATVTVPLPGVGRLHTLTDPDSGVVLQVVTAAAPGRGVLRRQDFVEFALLESVHGVVAQTYADDVKIDVPLDRVVFSRPGGLTLSAAEIGGKRGSAPVRALFDARQWEKDSKAQFRDRLDELISALRLAPEQARTAKRAALARFYIARGFYPEAKAVLDGAIAAERSEQADPSLVLLHAVSTVLMSRADLAEKDLTNAALSGSFDLELWKAMVLAGQAKWPQAREKFKNAGSAINALPVDLQRLVLTRAIQASLQVNDVGDADARMNELELIGISGDHAAPAAVLRGKIALAMGHEADALAAFQSAAQSANRPAAVEARLQEIALRLKGDDPAETDVLRDLETIAVTWRGDDSEIKALQMLARAYAKTGRYADALAATRAATLLQPNSEISRKLQDDAADLFTQIFLTAKGDAIPPIEALGMFYENRDLTPIGRRGDELIRRLAERLVAVDLLEQACELLQYQIDHRLEGQARTQVAARLATIYLMERKPDRALGALHSTRLADAGGDVRQQRLLLEARAQSDIGRRDLALDIIANVPGREAMRLRSDIHWAARRWSEAAEQIELYLGERWRDFTPLTPQDRSDVLRASIGYVLSGDMLGLGRFRDKFASLMIGTPEQGGFDTVTRMGDASGADLAQIAQLAAGVDTLDGFLWDMKTRFIDNAKPRQMSDAARR